MAICNFSEEMLLQEATSTLWSQKNDARVKLPLPDSIDRCWLDRNRLAKIHDQNNQHHSELLPFQHRPQKECPSHHLPLGRYFRTAGTEPGGLHIRENLRTAQRGRCLDVAKPSSPQFTYRISGSETNFSQYFYYMHHLQSQKQQLLTLYLLKITTV